MDCTDLYLKINHNLQENIQASLSSSHYTLFANANAFIDDYGLWQKWIAEYSFFIRFIKEIPKEKITDFESQIRESLGHLKEVTDYLSMINEDEK